MNTEERKCMECSGAMREVRLLDKGHRGGHFDFEYAAIDAQQSAWTSRFPVEGRVTAFMCQDCGAVRLFGKGSIGS